MRENIFNIQERNYLVEDYIQPATYEIGEKLMLVNDSVWGREVIGDQPHDEVLLELAQTPLLQRLQAIEQLTLGPEHATMPNSMGLSRWQHVWGCLVFARKMLAERDDLSPRDKMVLQVRTLLHDAGTTGYSHLGDHLFQGHDGGENLHDLELKDILRATGTDAILQKHGFEVDEVIFPPGQDWIENKAPALCVDRVDYGFREITRWVEPTIPFHLYKRELQQPEYLFEIDEQDRLVMTSEMMARYYAAGYGILQSEHWSHPVHKIVWQMLQSAVRSSVIDKVENSRMHPREAIYGVDNDFSAHFQTWDMLHLQSTMKQIAREQRQIFIEARRADLNRVFRNIDEPDWQFPALPDPLQPYNWQSREYGYPYSPRLVIEETDAPAEQPFEATDRGLVVNLLPIKARSIDPLIRVDGQAVLLSQKDPSYPAYLAGQDALARRSLRATVLMRSDVAERIVRRHLEEDGIWAELLKRERSAEMLGRVIREAGQFADLRGFDPVWLADDADIRSRAENFA